MTNAMKPITILVTALGGEGGGVLAEWLVDTAVRSGHSAQSTSIPGVAQRTGATTYYVEVFPLADAELGGRKPVFSLNPVAGRARPARLVGAARDRAPDRRRHGDARAHATSSARPAAA